jgi:hypothetical protein
MPEFTKPVPGNVCWAEALLEDPDRGKGFYGELFGWASQSVPSPLGTYNMMHIGGKFVAGVGKLAAEAKKMGFQSHWLNHVAVTDAAEMTEKAKRLGAEVLLAPHDVGPGMMAIIQDPTGAVLALWAAKKPMGTFLWAETNALCWVELSTTDVDAATSFYVDLFGWKAEPMDMGDFTYTILKNGDLSLGGLMQQFKEMAGAPSRWTSYFAVTDCDATVKKAGQLGATVLVPATDIPQVGRFAAFADPQGAAFSVIKGEPASV